MKKINFLLVGFVFLLSFIPFLWFPNNTILLGYDNVYPLRPLPFIIDRLYSWTNIFGFGMDQSGIQGSIIIHFIDIIPQLFGFSIQTSQKIVFSFWFFLMLGSAYIFIYRLEKYSYINNVYVKYFFPILYSVNFYVLQAWWIAERTKFSILVVLPLLLAILFPLVKSNMSVSKVAVNAFIAALVISIFNGGGWPGISLYGGLIICLACFYLLYMFIFLRSTQKRLLLYLSLFYVLLIIFVIFLNAYTLLPFLSITFNQYNDLVSRGGGIIAIVGWARYLSENTSFINLLRLEGIPDWYNNIYHAYSGIYLHNIGFIILSFVFPLLLFASFIINWNKKILIKIYFLLVLIISLLFTSGLRAPFGFIYEFMLTYVPGFIIFRSPIYKFGYAFWFAASFFISITLSSGVQYLVNRTDNTLKRLFITTIVVLFFIGSMLLYYFPYITGEIFHIDKTKVASRVEVPSYVDEFSNWWGKVGKDERILLLPQLNRNWYFEIYNWNYLSLNPILANYGNVNTIENTVLLTPQEQKLLQYLYDAINVNDKEAIDTFSTKLGIKYFLLRKDFFYNYPSIEVTNPQQIEEQLNQNSDLHKVAEFKKWIVYEINKERSQFQVINNSVISDTDETIYYPDKDFIQINASNALQNELTTKTIVKAFCKSCQGEQAITSVEFPKPTILLDSNLYQFVELKDKLNSRKEKSFDDQLFLYVGETLKYAGQLKQIIEFDKGDYYVNLARDKYITSLKLLDSRSKDIFKLSSNPFSQIMIIEQYLDAENKFLNDLILKSNKHEQQTNLERILYYVNDINANLKTKYSKENFNRQKVYTISLQKEGNYIITIDTQSLGNLNSSDLSAINLDFENKNYKPILKQKVLDFGSIYVSSGTHNFTLNLPPQKNILTEFERMNIAGRSCMVSYVRNYTKNKIYNIEFQIKNNFDPNFLFAVDDATEYAPKVLNYFPVSGEQVKDMRFVLNQQTFPVSDSANTVRIMFCAPSLNNEYFSKNVFNLSVVELTTPSIIFVNEKNQVSYKKPNVKVKKINQLTYDVSIENASDPFFFVFSKRYSPSWSSTVGQHFLGDTFENAWYIDKKGNYDFKITYVPQKYFYYGAAISIVFLILGSVVLIIIYKKTWKKK